MNKRNDHYVFMECLDCNTNWLQPADLKDMTQSRCIRCKSTRVTDMLCKSEAKDITIKGFKLI